MALKNGSKGKGKGGNKGGGEYDDSNRGVLFTNDKDGNENRPDYTGNIAIKAEDFEPGDDGLIRVRLAAWLHESPKVGQYLSLSASNPKPQE